MSNFGLPLCLSFLVTLSLGFAALNYTESAGNTYIYIRCFNRTSTSSPPYQSNVNLLLDYFTSAASETNFGKFKTVPPNDGIVYGLYQCRGDLASPNCMDCVNEAVTHLKTACSRTSTGGQVQLKEGCFVKYDNTSFFGAQDKTEMHKRCGGDNRSADVLKRTEDVLTSLVVGGKGQYFRRGDFGGTEGVAECLQDLILSDCEDCLKEASRWLRSECEASSSRGEMYLGKCYIRYADDHADDAGNENNNKNMANNDYGGYSGDIGGGGGGRKIKLIGIIAAIITLVVAAVAAVGGLVFKFRNSCNNNGTFYCCSCCFEF